MGKQSLKFLCLVGFTVLGSSGHGALTPVIGKDLFKGNELQITAPSPQGKGSVVVFLSAKCPCSDSHLKELKALSSEYPGFRFVGVHSNADESPELTKTYFAKAELPFTVLQDEKSKLADEFKALKTPHAFVIAADGSLLYQGGVSSSKEFEKAERKFLREALDDLQNDRKVRTPEGRTLGCVISRGEKYVW